MAITTICYAFYKHILPLIIAIIFLIVMIFIMFYKFRKALKNKNGNEVIDKIKEQINSTQLNLEEVKQNMDVTGFVKASGTFLKADNIKSNPSATFNIQSEGKLVKSEKYGTDRVHLEGVFNGQDVIFDCSKTNARVISEKLGKDTAKWIGHNLVLETYKTKTTDGKLVEAINVKEVK